MNEMMDIVTVIIVGTAAVIDARCRRIPNWLTLITAAAGFFGGFLFSIFNGDFQGGWQWMLFSGKGWLVGLGIFLIPFMLGGMGGGDVKLLGAVGALKGAGFVIETAFFGAFWGGLMAVSAIIISRQHGILKRFGLGLKLYALTGGQAGKEFLVPDDNNNGKKKLYVPYGVAIFLGVLTTYVIGEMLPI
jgi:prepilin peptidase CpaA